MNSYCPLCFSPVQGAQCPHCNADVEQIKKLRVLEKIAESRNTTATLNEVVRLYRRMGRKAALGRILGKLADHSLQTGEWQAAQHYLEQTLTLGETAGNPTFRTTIKRKLALLLGRRGELPLAYHLLGQAEAEGDSQARLDKLRLEMDERAKRHVLQTLNRLDKSTTTDVLAQAWQLEAKVRFSTFSNDAPLRTALTQMRDNAHATAIVQRALGIWLANHLRGEEAQTQLQASLAYFKTATDPYEAARTQLDLARAYLLSDLNAKNTNRLNASLIGVNDVRIVNALELLGQAITTFRRLGTPLLDTQASELAETLTIGRGFTGSSTLTNRSAALIWLAMDGVWSEKVWEQALFTAKQQGGIPEKMLGGIMVLMGEAQHGGNLKVVVDTALALYDLMLHHKAKHRLKPKNKFHLTVALGSLPQHPTDLTQTLRALPRSKLFHMVRTIKNQPEQVLVNQRLYINTQAYYRYTAFNTPSEHITPDAPTVVGDSWWRLTLPQYDPIKSSTPKRYSLRGYEAVFKKIDPVLDIFKQRQLGGMLALIGEAGTGKSRLLSLLIDELQAHSKGWLIHLRGREATRHEPFGAVRHWLGEGFEPPKAAASERRLSHIATFRRSIVGLLHSRPLILAVDDIHLLDSGSLEALKAILSLTATHTLMLLVTARPHFVDTEKGSESYYSSWQEVTDLGRRALPDRTAWVDLPSELAYRPSDLPEDPVQQHLLACAAVLGDRFMPLVLRRMSSVVDVYYHLSDLKQKGILTPSEEAHYWRFVQTAARDYFYEGLDPTYRAILHWYARQTLKVLDLEPDEHIHPAGLSDPALRISMRRAQEALTLDSPQEALLHFNRALQHYQGDDLLIDLYLGKATALLSLNDLNGVQEILNKLQNLPNLDPHDEASLLIFQGELLYRVGEVALLFRIYEQAAEKLRSAPDADISEQVSIIYAQALGRFKRDELEMARSMIGGALLMAQGAGLDNELADFWDLIAQIHQRRGEIQPAYAAVQKAIVSYKAAGGQWQLMKPLERCGTLMMEAGELDEAHEQLKNALDLAESIGERAAVTRLHQLLGKIALYRGEFGKLTAHLASALHVALFADSPTEVVLARAALAEGLALEGRLVPALQEATLAMHLAELTLDRHALATAQLAVARVTLALNCMDDAEQALRQAEFYTQLPAAEPALKWQVHLTQMQFAMLQKDDTAFNEALNASRNLPSLTQDSFWRARRNLLVGQYKAQLQEWNNAARELEHAVRAFAKLGATYWQRQAMLQLQKIAPYAPGYQQEGRYHLRGEGVDRNAEQGQ